MKLESLHKLYVQQLKDLYSAENQLLKALPKMQEAATNEELKQAFGDHLNETKEQVARLEKVFKSLDFEPGGHKCEAMAGLIKEGEEMIKADAPNEVRDAGLIAAAQRVEHYEMAGYGTCRAYAEKMGDQEAADILQQTLDEEARADESLNRLAERSINFLAMQTTG